MGPVSETVRLICVVRVTTDDMEHSPKMNKIMSKQSELKAEQEWWIFKGMGDAMMPICVVETSKKDAVTIAEDELGETIVNPDLGDSADAYIFPVTRVVDDG